VSPAHIHCTHPHVLLGTPVHTPHHSSSHSSSMLPTLLLMLLALLLMLLTVMLMLCEPLGVARGCVAVCVMRLIESRQVVEGVMCVQRALSQWHQCY